jgi:hypothetical protein
MYIHCIMPSKFLGESWIVLIACHELSTFVGPSISVSQSAFAHDENPAAKK